MSDRILFIDRDGTLIEEPEDFQVDRLDKVRLVAGVIPALLQLNKFGYTFVMVSNQDGLGTAAFPEEQFVECQEHVLQLLESQGIALPKYSSARTLRKMAANVGSRARVCLTRFLAANDIDLAGSAVIGDRPTDAELAQRIGVRSFNIDEDAAGSWESIVTELCYSDRRARVDRKTKETDISAAVNLDREAPIAIATGIGFFDHMLEQIAKHGGFPLEMNCSGDLEIDDHHTVEDTALCLGSALREALAGKVGIGRYGFVVPMDESEARVSIDLSGRARFVFDGKFPTESVGEMSTQMVQHFFQSLSDTLGAALHIEVSGENAHHMVEACFKSVGRVLRQATTDVTATHCRVPKGPWPEMSGIAIIDSGGANIASLKFALQRLGADAEITGDARSIRAADRVILPGVGAAANAMQRLRELQLTDVIRNLSQPVLGICLGLQLLCQASAEEDVECLGILDGRAEQLPGTPELPVPNMGWCPVQLNSDHPVMADIADHAYFYFVHSYACTTE